MRRTAIRLKKTAWIAVIICLTMMLSACDAKSEKSQIQIVTTVFPTYDWTMQVIGDNPADIEVTYLLEDGVDIHSYQPSAEDIVTILESDLLICPGGESDEWIEEVLEQGNGTMPTVIRLTEVDGITLYEEERTPGMKEERGESHEHAEHDESEHEDDSHEDESEHEHEEEHADDLDEHADEHVWMSLENAEAITQAIAEVVGELDSENQELYWENALAYTDDLEVLRIDMKEAVQDADVDTLVFADRYPFRYLTEELGLEYFAAFAGCSAESEADFDTILFLSKKIDELDLWCVMLAEDGDVRLAETVASGTEAGTKSIYRIDSMQAVSSEDIQDGKNYIDTMKNNMDVLKKALHR